MNDSQIRESAKYIEKEGTTVKLVPPEETVENKSSSAMAYDTQAVAIAKIEINMNDEIKACLGSLMQTATIGDRGKIIVLYF